MLLELKARPTYGPVNSRRLGRSLGINPVRPGGKVCTFDCAYCHFGWAKPVHRGGASCGAFFTEEEILVDLERRLLELPEAPAYLTFSGNGEPTLHPQFARLVEGAFALGGRLAPGARVAVLSNSTTVCDAAVRAALGRLDLRVMKLDAGTDEVFARFNRPAAGVGLGEVVEGLRSLGGVTLQSLFAAGPGGNLGPGHAEAWAEAVVRVRPAEVHLYTLARDTPSKRLMAAPPGSLEAIAVRLEGLGLKARVF